MTAAWADSMTHDDPLRRPQMIWILGQPFSVRWEDAPGKRLHEDSDGYWELGTTVVDEQVVVIRSKQGEYQLRDTVLHEVLHAILNMTAQRDRFKPNDAHEKHPEEPVVAAIATALLGVLNANPNLVDWLVDRIVLPPPVTPPAAPDPPTRPRPRSDAGA